MDLLDLLGLDSGDSDNFVSRGDGANCDRAAEATSAATKRVDRDF